MLTRSIQDFISNSKINRNWSQKSIEINRKLSTFIFDIEMMSFRGIISDWIKIIISAIDSPLYSLAIFLHKIFYKISVDSFSYIKNNFHLIEILSKKTLDDNLF